jgi:hypothetical protein
LTIEDLAVPLVVAASASLAAWIALVAFAAFATRARDPEAQPAALELGGDEPPAVVNLLTNGWKVRGEAVPATLVDLAARKVVSFEQTEPDRFQVRVTNDGAAAALADYERQVLDAVTELASNGVVPCEALTTGTEQQSRRWYARFNGRVTRDARQRGLSRPRWGRAVTVSVTLLAALTAALVGGAAIAVIAANSKDGDTPIGALLGIGFATFSVLMGIFGALRADRDTDAGLAAAGRWLGLRDNLAADGTFPELPPTAVAVWDRYLAFAVALDLAASTTHTLHLGAESDHEAWSAVTGTWRLVRVRYPKRIPPGWGRAPWQTLAAGILQLACLAGLVRLLIYASAEAWAQAPELQDDNQSVVLVATLVLSALACVAVVLALRALVMVVLGVTDVRRARTIEGRVLRVRATKGPNKTTIIRWAVDDGTSDEIRAWAGGAMVPRQGAQVRAVVSPRLGYVRSIEVLDGHATIVPPGVSASQGAVGPPPSAGPPPDLDTAALPADS